MSSWTNISVGGYAGVFLTGIVFDLSVEKTTGTTSHSWKFYGDTPSTDTVGSSNMVVSGTFEDAISNPNSVVGQHPEDLKLMKLGVFDDTDGMFDQGSVPVLLMSGYKVGDKDVLQLLKPTSEETVCE